MSADDDRCPECGQPKAMHEVIYAPIQRGQGVNIPVDACPNTPIIAPPDAGPGIRHAN